MTRTVYTHGDGLGIAPWIIPVVASIGASVAGAVATKYIAGGSPSQKEIEKQVKLQQQEEIRRMVQAQAEAAAAGAGGDMSGYLLPALGVVAFVMLLR